MEVLTRRKTKGKTEATQEELLWTWWHRKHKEQKVRRRADLYVEGSVYSSGMMQMYRHRLMKLFGGV